MQRHLAHSVFEAGRSAATTTDGQSILVADAAFTLRDATAQERALHVLDTAVSAACAAHAIAQSVSTPMSNLSALSRGLKRHRQRGGPVVDRSANDEYPPSELIRTAYPARTPAKSGVLVVSL